jgi:macrocin-O-methyltransferase TylF-like protien
MDDGITQVELTSESVDALIVSLAGSPHLSGQDHLLRKLDHLVHALRMSGQLAALTQDQVKSIVYSLYAAGHLKTPTPIAPDGMLATYAEDGLVTIHNADFVGESRFRKAYQRGVSAEAVDYHIHWRVHISLWAASHALHLPGDFIECGVNRGFQSSAIMDYLEWNNLNRRFFLLDTFQGLDERFISDEEKAAGKSSSYRGYSECFEETRKNFEEFRNVVLIRGPVPLTLAEVDSDRICYLHLDMNCVPPEVAALEYFWDKLVPGAVVLLDDYAAFSHHFQKRAMDGFAADRAVQILSLPTGQGMILKH